MLGTMALVLSTFTWMVVRSYKRASADGEAFQPEGKLRWTEGPDP